MQNKLLVKTTIYCDTCGCNLKRKKTIVVDATEMEAAKSEANQKIQSWKKTLIGQNCKVCQSIIDSK